MTRFAYFCGHEQWHPEQLVEHARLAEAAGFDMVMVSEHFHPWVDDDSAAGFAFSTIGAMAAVTERIEFTTAVTTPLFRFHPAIVAQAAATLDRLSNGRFNLGVGTGENLNEGPLGYAFPKYAERAARMREALQIMRSLLDGDKLTLNGEFYSTDRAKLYSPPVHRVPIFLAAGGPKSALLAAELADGVITSVKDPDETNERVIQPLKLATEDPRTVLATRWTLRARDEDEAWEVLRPWRGLRAPGRLEAVDPADLRERADLMPREEVIGRYTLAYEPAEIIASYLPLVEQIKADVVTFQMSSRDQAGLIELLGKEVLPELRTR